MGGVVGGVRDGVRVDDGVRGDGHDVVDPALHLEAPAC